MNSSALPNNPTLPAKLYKYFAPACSQIFDDWLIRFTQPGALNDPFEMRPHISGYGTTDEVFAIAETNWEAHTKSKYEELAKQPDYQISYADYRVDMEKHHIPMVLKGIEKAPEYNAEMASKIDKMINSSVGVLSLCTHLDSLLMWAHYGDSHRGFVVEFDTTSPFFKQERPPAHVAASDVEAVQFAEEHGRLRIVHYSNQRPSLVVTKMLFDHLLTKGLPWKYEDEWRMLMPLDYADEKKPDHRGYPVRLFKTPPSAVSKIILGYSADADLTARALTLRNRVETNHIAIEKARIDEQHFQLNFEPVE